MQIAAGLDYVSISLATEDALSHFRPFSAMKCRHNTKYIPGPAAAHACARFQLISKLLLPSEYERYYLFEVWRG